MNNQYELHGPVVRSGVTAAAAAIIVEVPQGASVTAYPTSAGTATVYASTSRLADCIQDVAAGDFVAGAAKWEAWAAGAVTGKNSEVALGSISAVAIQVADGTWTLEVCR